MVISPRSVNKSQHRVRGSARENLGVAVQRKDLQGMGVEWFIAMDSWQTYVFFFALRSFNVPDCLFYSGLGEERPLVRNFIALHLQNLTFSTSSAIIQHIIARHERESVPGSIAYFYFDFKDTEKQHRRNLLRSLLIQLSAYSNPCCDLIRRIYSAHGRGTQQPSDDTLKKCLKDMLSAMTQHPSYIVLDALDECPDTTGVPSAREEVLNLVNELVDLRLPNLHICATSRPEIDIRTVLEPSTSLRISLHDQPGQKEDIAEYIRCVAHSDTKMKRWREDDRKMVIDVLSERADGM